MDIKGLFNLILISVSLTTVLITIVSYIIFRLRNSVGVNKRKEVHPMESHYFRRYAPQLQKINDDFLATLAKKSNRLRLKKMSLGATFGFTLLVVTGLLAAENYFGFRAELRARTKSAEDYKKLLDAGLLRHFDFDPSQTKLEYREDLKSIGVSKSLINQLKRNTLQILVQSDAVEFAREVRHPQAFKTKSARIERNTWRVKSPIASEENHAAATQKWVRFLERYELGFVVATEVNQIRNGMPLLIADHRQLSDEDRTQLRRFVQNGGRLILSGLSGQSQERKFEWVTAMTDLIVRDNSRPDRNSPTLLSADRGILVQVPPGLLIPWYPSNNDHTFWAPVGSGSAFQGDFKGELAVANEKESVRITHKSIGRGVVVWTNLDPMDPGSDGKEFLEEFLVHSDNGTLAILRKAFGEPGFKIADWPRVGHEPVTLAIDARHDLYAAAQIVQLARNHQLPSSVFVPQGEFNNLSDITQVLGDGDEIGLYFGEPLGSLRTNDLALFHSMHNARLKLEETVKRHITSFRFDEGVLDERAIGIGRLSGFNYFLGDLRLFRIAPVAIGSSSFYTIPRSVDDDFNLKSNKTLATPEQMSEQMHLQYQRNRRLGGGYFYQVSSKITGDDFAQRALDAFLQKTDQDKTWKTTSAELTRWTTNRNKLRIEYSEPQRRLASKAWNVKVKNESRNPIPTSSLVIEPNGSFEPSVAGVESSSQTILEKQNDLYVLTLPPLGVGEEREFSVQFK